jgi:hypothetical protein
MQNFFWFVSNFEHVNFAISKYIYFKLWQSKLLCFTYDLSDIQKCSFKECTHFGGSVDYAFTHLGQVIS